MKLEGSRVPRDTGRTEIRGKRPNDVAFLFGGVLDS